MLSSLSEITLSSQRPSSQKQQQLLMHPQTTRQQLMITKMMIFLLFFSRSINAFSLVGTTMTRTRQLVPSMMMTRNSYNKYNAGTFFPQRTNNKRRIINSSSAASSYTSSWTTLLMTSNNNNKHNDDGTNNKDDLTKSSRTENEGGGIYRPFMEYAWNKLNSSGLVQKQQPEQSTSSSSTTILTNSSPAKGFPDGTTVSIEIQSSPGYNTSSNGQEGGMRLGRYALLETLTPTVNEEEKEESETSQLMTCVPNAIHVLNLVLFPSHTILPSLSLPVLGMDLVTLPGGKHLIAIDFQPTATTTTTTTEEEEEQQQQSRTVFPIESPYYKTYESRLAALHQKHVLDKPDVLPWGGDIPPNAKRFFSPYALWTRLSDGGTGVGTKKGKKVKNDDDINDGEIKEKQKKAALDVIREDVYDAFCDYFDLYMELLLDIQNNTIDKDDNTEEVDEDNNKDGDSSSSSLLVVQGHRDYLNYRLANDPARPMLTRLYGEEWTEDVLSEVLFKMI